MYVCICVRTRDCSAWYPGFSLIFPALYWSMRLEDCSFPSANIRCLSSNIRWDGVTSSMPKVIRIQTYKPILILTLPLQTKTYTKTKSNSTTTATTTTTSTATTITTTTTTHTITTTTTTIPTATTTINAVLLCSRYVYINPICMYVCSKDVWYLTL